MDDDKKLSRYVSTMYIHVKEAERKTTSTKMAKKENTKERFWIYKDSRIPVTEEEKEEAVCVYVCLALPIRRRMPRT